MKKCRECGRQNPDNALFCIDCGVPLADHGSQGSFCSKCGTKNEAGSVFCSKCGAAFSNDTENRGKIDPVIDRGGSGQNRKMSGDSILIAVMAGFVLLLAVVVASILLVKYYHNTNNQVSQKDTPTEMSVSEDSDTNASENPDTNASENPDTDAYEDQDTDVSTDQDVDESTDSDANSEDEEIDLGVYQSYFDGIDDTFEKLIISDSQKGQLKSYKEALKDAIDSNNQENCDYNKVKLDELTEAARSASRSKIDSLKENIKKYEAKSRTKKVKNSTEYKKNKNFAKNAMSSGDYRNAKTYYEACLDDLKKAKKEKTSSSGTSSGSGKKNDSTYKYGGKDNKTYSEVYLDYLNATAVSTMSFETRRYYMNTLFAANGYRFSNKTIQKFFNNQSWYSPDYSVSRGDQLSIIKKFDAVCKYNYKLLKKN